jgi:hypothetical protein
LAGTNVSLLFCAASDSLITKGSGPRGLYDKKFYGHNFTFFRTKLVFVAGKPFQSSLVFAGKARAYLSEKWLELASNFNSALPVTQFDNRNGPLL